MLELLPQPLGTTGALRASSTTLPDFHEVIAYMETACNILAGVVGNYSLLVEIDEGQFLSPTPVIAVRVVNSLTKMKRYETDLFEPSNVKAEHNFADLCTIMMRYRVKLMWSFTWKEDLSRLKISWWTVRSVEHHLDSSRDDW